MIQKNGELHLLAIAFEKAYLVPIYFQGTGPVDILISLLLTKWPNGQMTKWPKPSKDCVYEISFYSVPQIVWCSPGYFIFMYRR